MKVNFVTILILIEIVSPINTIFSNTLKKLKQKSKNAYKKKFGKDKTWHFLGFDLTEYPGTNEKYLQINKDKWDEYYACLLAQNSKLGRDYSVTPEAIEAFESTSISPQETTKIDSVEWYWAGKDNPKLTPVDYSDSILVSPLNRSLQLYNLQKEHTGQYICRIGEAEASPYFLTVIEGRDEDLLQVHSLESPSEPHPQKPKTINGYKIMIDTEWSPWTSCSKCDQIGRRHRVGCCILKYEESPTKTVESNDTESETATLKEDHYELLRIFKFGIPCNSHILPYSFKKLHSVKNRQNEIMTGFCRMSCPGNEIFEIRDKNGKVIESANNSAGIYSVLQGIPSMQPSVERSLQYAEKGKKVALSCPGNLNSDASVQWQVGSKKLIPEILSAESKGRMYVSITDKLHFKEAKLSDTNIYSCWQHNELSGTVRLIVEKKMSLDFNHHIMLFGAVAIFSVFLYIFVKAFFRRKTVRKVTFAE